MRDGRIQVQAGALVHSEDMRQEDQPISELSNSISKQRATAQRFISAASVFLPNEPGTVQFRSRV